MKDFLSYLVSHIVDHPSEVTIEETESGMGSFLYTIKVNNEDVGKIIGKGGKIISAIRNVVKVIAIKENKQVRVEIGEPAIA